MDKNGPIGIIDSGVGGITVLKRLLEILPEEDYIYFGDTLRVPYGNRPKEEIEKFTREIVNYLKKQKVKAVVIACNTICSSINKNDYEILMFGILEAGIKSAVEATSNGRIGVIATKRTVESEAYLKGIKRLNRNAMVFQKACPELVLIVENGFYEASSIYSAVKKCTEEFLEKDIDTLVLGCTHFPILLPFIERVVDNKVTVVDPAIKLAHEVKKYLVENNLVKDKKGGQIRFLVTGEKENFIKVAGTFLNDKHIDVLRIAIEELK
ncbi:MAG: glutamate racemase [Caldanaerobacter sp.]|uniref:Glutamate racemase 1 n=1 Tax=Caldanaerobacter subterraneus subsp. tengcongensis (strain DSM 15242 / JCM 11007 / NBRC 100824 / MB4) TaxID=273068 RepID=MURI1_CALS4|nr:MULTISPECIES: glutamate racemase [Caldanaerobacter]Q8RD38.1 RecName: Full=Glutamate racemase 1 [Caldanaerobacter subterraneus subsp. tengcongensis MB4]AAM23510.1 Glutamate racemase [Caldanaerobacter subterraneus subsp. tengcongensis MB4]MDI3519269.1 glutamate racemase [Caldanaerobacter sp.]